MIRKNQAFGIIRFLLPILFLVFLFGCQNIVDEESNETLSSTSIDEFDNDQAVTATETSAIDMIPESKPTATMTTEEVEERIRSLLDSNGECDLPCWWGIIPGQTTWDEAYSILKPVANKINNLVYGNYGIEVNAPDDIFDDYEIGATLDMRGDTVEMIRVPLLYGFTLDRMLSQYGSPAEIYVYSLFQTMVTPPILVRLVLFYEEQGILLIYEGRTENTNPLEICPGNLDEDGFTWAYLWSPEDKRSFSDFSNKTPFGGFSGKYLPLSEETSINIETFYDWYRNPNNLPCFEMPNPTMKPASP